MHLPQPSFNRAWDEQDHFTTPLGRPHGIWPMPPALLSSEISRTAQLRSDPFAGLSSVGKSASDAHGSTERTVIACLISNRADEVGVALGDALNLRISLTQIADTSAFSKTIAHLAAAEPFEIVLPHNLANSRLATALMNGLDDLGCSFVSIPRRCFSDTHGSARLMQIMPSGEEYADVVSEIQDHRRYLSCAAAAALIARIEQQHNCVLVPGTVRVSYLALAKHVDMDRSAVSALQLLSPPRVSNASPAPSNIRKAPAKLQQHGTASAPLTLSEVIDTTVTRMGRRLLRSNLLQPISHLPTLNPRFDAVEVLLSRSTTAALPLKSHLQSSWAFDFDAVLGVFARNPSDRGLPQLIQTVSALGGLRQILLTIRSTLSVLNSDAKAGTAQPAAVSSAPPEIKRLRDECILLESIATALSAASPDDLLEKIDAVLDPAMFDQTSEHSAAFKQSIGKQVQLCFMVRDRIDPELDQARAAYSRAIEDIVQHTEEVKSAHNIASLKLVSHARNGFHFSLDGRQASQLDLDVFCHVVLPKSNGANAKATCTTRVLQRLDRDSQESMINVLLLQDRNVMPTVEEVRLRIGRLHIASEALALLDVLLSHVSMVMRGFGEGTATSKPGSFSGVRPVIQPYGPFTIVDGRPLGLDSSGAACSATQNFSLDGTSRTLAILTGPNGSGKTTLLRTLARWALLAHVGSFVPAATAHIPLLEGICTRFSASDAPDTVSGSFFRDMADLSHVARVARRRHLILLDEIGRGTSPTEGCSIAWAVAERLADVRCITVLATHYVPLTRLPYHISSACNMHLRTVAVGKGLSFEYTIADGACDVEHYGLTLAYMLGIPSDVLDAAKRNVEHLSSRHTTSSNPLRDL